MRRAQKSLIPNGSHDVSKSAPTLHSSIRFRLASGGALETSSIASIASDPGDPAGGRQLCARHGVNPAVNDGKHSCASRGQHSLVSVGTGVEDRSIVVGSAQRGGFQVRAPLVQDSVCGEAAGSTGQEDEAAWLLRKGRLF